MAVGAGLAGLSCAYRPRQAGVDAAVFEARSDRVGGRCFTVRDFADGQVGEYGGEFIDSKHRRLRSLIREHGLSLEDRIAPRGGPPLSDRYLFEGRLVSSRAITTGEPEFMRRASTAGASLTTGRPTPGPRSYAAFLPGQTTRFASIIKSPEGGVHFAGEQTSVAFQGFLEGAVESGERAAREVLAAR